LALTLNGIADEMADASFSPGGQQIASTGLNNDIKVWDAATGALLQTLPAHTAYVSHVVWVDENRFISNDWSGAIRSWTRAPSGSFAVDRVWSTGGQSLGIAVSPDKTKLAVGGANAANDGFVFLSL
jgi:WD40 repeat protein